MMVFSTTIKSANNGQVVDLELISVAELRDLRARFLATAFVCIHSKHMRS